MPRPLRQVTLRERSTAEKLARGHPWIWLESVGDGFDGVAIGEEVEVLAPDRTVVGHGVAEPMAQIAVRLWTRGRHPIDGALLRSRAERALETRKRLLGHTHTDAFRVIHGEGDRMPGLVVDRYGPIAVMRTDGEALAPRVQDLADAVWPAVSSLGVSVLVLRTGARGLPPRLEVLRGTAPPDTVRVQEYGVPFVVDIARGQKTGAFLDQRDNRRRVGEIAGGRRVLNLFSYAGGFSLHAALGGARHVTSVDVAAAAHGTAQLSFRAADLDPSLHAFVTADVY